MYAMIRECNQGAVRCVMLEADAGLGKTALLAALCRDPLEQDVTSNSESEPDVHVVRAQVSLFAV